MVECYLFNRISWLGSHAIDNPSRSMPSHLIPTDKSKKRLVTALRNKTTWYLLSWCLAPESVAVGCMRVSQVRLGPTSVVCSPGRLRRRPLHAGNTGDWCSAESLLFVAAGSGEAHLVCSEREVGKRESCLYQNHKNSVHKINHFIEETYYTMLKLPFSSTGLLLLSCSSGKQWSECQKSNMWLPLLS